MSELEAYREAVEKNRVYCPFSPALVNFTIPAVRQDTQPFAPALTVAADPYEPRPSRPQFLPSYI
jgi:hypothetical protein